MKSPVWVYESPVGVFVIRYSPSKRKYETIFNDDCVAEYDDPAACADDVRAQVTGVDEWDNFVFRRGNPPSDLSEWRRIQ